MTKNNLTKDEQFVVGDIAIAQFCREPLNNGKEVLILNTPQPVDWVTDDNHLVLAGHYRIRGPNSVAQILPFRLRRKTYKDDLRSATWANCPWQPERVQT